MAERQGNTAEGGVDGAVEGDDLPNDDAEETFPVEENWWYDGTYGFDESSGRLVTFNKT